MTIINLNSLMIRIIILYNFNAQTDIVLNKNISIKITSKNLGLIVIGIK